MVQLEVQWQTAEKPFAIDGDSGNLIFAKDKGTVIPLGLHCGSKGTISYSLSTIHMPESFAVPFAIMWAVD